MRILIVRTSAIGDVVFASALPGAIRRAHPDAHIAWLVEPGIHELLLPDPAIDEVITWSKGEWVKLWKSGRRLELLGRVRQLRRELRARRFDVAVDLQGLLKSGFLTWLSGAPRRVGLGSKEGSQWLMSEVIPRGGEKARIGSEYQYLAQQLGFDAGDFLPTLTVAPETEAAVAAKLEAHGLQVGRFAVFAPFTTRPQKHWFEDAWQALAPQLIEATGLTPVILGGPADQQAAARIAAADPRIVNLAGQTRLPEAAAVIAHAALLIGVDTGLTHMGTALARPTVAIFGSTCPYQNTGRSTGSVIWLGMPCSPCRRRPTCGGKFTCLRDITPQRVLQQAQAMLAAEHAR
ncbi:lipopolysaccharide heptosyltransferase II [Zoogloea dura]|jgi:heptosyltransferase-1|uniref:lipopolysaccharide heptosyltransferase II n=1 Tax=Zoogloea dura TaxID=2728840 RepID=A0A848G2A7_9RHOO|nr:lipopolysaccharide heptosyltransferase II [Zoogloea dura]NML25289.1 lipopolysaccharide heptosyltransferase II [Zoogloea dura]